MNLPFSPFNFGRKAAFFVVLSSSLFLTTSCNDDESGNNNNSGDSSGQGTSSFVISGDEEGSTQGTASFRNKEIAPGTGEYTATLTAGNSEFGAVTIATQSLDELMEIETGNVYVIGTLGDVLEGDADFHVSYMNSESFFYNPMTASGTLEFSSVSTDIAEGIFEFTLTTPDNPNFGGARSITVTEGMFSAVVR